MHARKMPLGMLEGMNRLRIAVFGAAGRLGQAILREARRDPQFLPVAAIVRTNSSKRGLPTDDPSLGFIGPAHVPAHDVLIDASGASGLDDLLDIALRSEAAIVSGSTGYSAEQFARLQALGANRAVFWSANLSLGVAVLQTLLAHASALLGDEWDCEIIETHHRHKKDAPSGTALGLLATIEAARGHRTAPVFGRHGENESRAAGEIGIHAVRGGDVIGDHVVHFVGQGERISLSHSATSRDVFALGALCAARFIAAQPAGFNGMAELLAGVHRAAEKQ